MAKVVSGGVTIELTRKEFAVLLEMLGNMSRDATSKYLNSTLNLEEKIEVITRIYRQLMEN